MNRAPTTQIRESRGHVLDCEFAGAQLVRSVIVILLRQPTHRPRINITCCRSYHRNALTLADAVGTGPKRAFSVGSIVNSFALLPGIEQQSQFYTNAILIRPHSGFVQQRARAAAQRERYALQKGALTAIILKTAIETYCEGLCHQICTTKSQNLSSP